MRQRLKFIFVLLLTLPLLNSCQSQQFRQTPEIAYDFETTNLVQYSEVYSQTKSDHQTFGYEIIDESLVDYRIPRSHYLYIRDNDLMRDFVLVQRTFHHNLIELYENFGPTNKKEKNFRRAYHYEYFSWEEDHESYFLKHEDHIVFQTEKTTASRLYYYLYPIQFKSTLDHLMSMSFLLTTISHSAQNNLNDEQILRITVRYNGDAFPFVNEGEINQLYVLGENS